MRIFRQSGEDTDRIARELLGQPAPAMTKAASTDADLLRQQEENLAGRIADTQKLSARPPATFSTPGGDEVRAWDRLQRHAHTVGLKAVYQHLKAHRIAANVTATPDPLPDDASLKIAHGGFFRKSTRLEEVTLPVSLAHPALDEPARISVAIKREAASVGASLQYRGETFPFDAEGFSRMLQYANRTRKLAMVQPVASEHFVTRIFPKNASHGPAHPYDHSLGKFKFASRVAEALSRVPGVLVEHVPQDGEYGSYYRLAMMDPDAERGAAQILQRFANYLDDEATTAPDAAGEEETTEEFPNESAAAQKVQELQTKGAKFTQRRNPDGTISVTQHTAQADVPRTEGSPPSAKKNTVVPEVKGPNKTQSRSQNTSTGTDAPTGIRGDQGNFTEDSSTHGNEIILPNGANDTPSHEYGGVEIKGPNDSQKTTFGRGTGTDVPTDTGTVETYFTRGKKPAGVKGRVEEYFNRRSQILDDPMVDPSVVDETDPEIAINVDLDPEAPLGGGGVCPDCGGEGIPDGEGLATCPECGQTFATDGGDDPLNDGVESTLDDTVDPDSFLMAGDRPNSVLAARRQSPKTQRRAAGPPPAKGKPNGRPPAADSDKGKGGQDTDTSHPCNQCGTVFDFPSNDWQCPKCGAAYRASKRKAQVQPQELPDPDTATYKASHRARLAAIARAKKAQLGISDEPALNTPPVDMNHTMCPHCGAPNDPANSGQACQECGQPFRGNARGGWLTGGKDVSPYARPNRGRNQLKYPTDFHEACRTCGDTEILKGACGNCGTPRAAQKGLPVTPAKPGKGEVPQADRKAPKAPTAKKVLPTNPKSAPDGKGSGRGPEKADPLRKRLGRDVSTDKVVSGRVYPETHEG